MQAQPPRQDSPNRVRASSLARLQQALVLGAVLLAAIWVLATGPHSAAGLLAGPALLAVMHAVILGIETLAAAVINRSDGSQQATAWQWVRAWWQEVKVAPLVFAWRQPFCWRQWPDTTVPPTVPQPGVVFIHGFFCNRGFWLPWMARLEKLGMPYTSVNLEPIFGSIDDYAPIVDDAVRRATELTGRAPILVCHSMGGLAARACDGGDLVGVPLHRAVQTSGEVHACVSIGTARSEAALMRRLHRAAEHTAIAARLKGIGRK